MDTLVIGIAGGTGSGKTTLMKNLVERFQGDVAVVSHDNYYKRNDHMTYEERSQINYDEPAAFDTDLMVQQLEQLRRGESVLCPVYDYTVHNRSDETVVIEPKRVIVVEGILIFADEALREMMDIRRSTGDVDIRGCDAPVIVIETDTGDVTGSLLTGKLFDIRTSTGNVQIPKSTLGGECRITTSTGDIRIVIE